MPYTLLLLLCSVTADTPPPLPPFAWLDPVAEHMYYLTREAEAPKPAPALPAWAELLRVRLGLAETPRSAADAEEIAMLRGEMESLRETTREMQQTMDHYLNTSLLELREENSRLRAENEALRDELKRLYAGGAKVAQNVPRPNDRLYDALLAEALAEAPAAPATEEMATPAGPSEPVIVSEWERTPEQVADLPGEVPSLKGVVLFVSPNLSADELLALGRELRAKYEGFDNINIEAFNDREAAQSFAERNVSSGPEHRVMAVSRHAATGRDVVLLLDSAGKATEFPVVLGAAEASATQ